MEFFIACSILLPRRILRVFFYCVYMKKINVLFELILATETTEQLPPWPSAGEVTTPHWGQQRRGRLMWTFHCWDLTRVNTPPSQRDARLWSHQIFTKISYKLPYLRIFHGDIRVNPYLRRTLQKSRFPHYGNTIPLTERVWRIWSDCATLKSMLLENAKCNSLWA